MTKKIDTSLECLRSLEVRIGKKYLEDADWSIVESLVSNFIAKQENRIARLHENSTALESANNSKNPPDADSSNPEASISDPKSDSHYDDNDNHDGNLDGSCNSDKNPSNSKNPPKNGNNKPKGHGRNSSSDFKESTHLWHKLANIIGAICACGSGRMTRYRERIVIRVIGQPIFAAEQHHCEQARCKICGRVVTAALPTGTLDGLGKAVTYDWSACAMLLVLHYFYGMPFKRLETLHNSWGIPFADANQWHIARESMILLRPLFDALARHAIQNGLDLRMDDTGGEILTLRRQINAELAAAKALGLSEDDVRRGINASGFYINTEKEKILLYFTGRHHAAEVLRKLLIHRLSDSPKMNKVTDGASKNFDASLAHHFVEGACNVHAFLKFEGIKQQYPEEYAVVGEAYHNIYKQEQIAVDHNLTPAARLLLHQQKSTPWMNKIREMCQEKIAKRLVEPRSPLWEPIHFFINQWWRLTKFLETEGMPLDTNVCEQSLIAPVRYLAASFNYQTETGAETGDQAMSLIATARANGAEPFAWLTHCLKNHQDLTLNPENYLPWVYRDQMKTKNEVKLEPPPKLHLSEVNWKAPISPP
jgi:hypothetical protein